jgi:putative ABC transport system substrate-binding protein
MKRREFTIGLLLATAAAFRARAQQPAMPVVGFLHSSSPDTNANLLAAFRLGLKETGYVEGQNVAIEFRWADGQLDRLPALAADLVRRRVAVIVTGGISPLTAKAATATIPIVFATGGDPVAAGLVASLNRPGGNLTGVTQFTAALEAKRLELLHELVPNAAVIAVLVNPNYPDAGKQQRDVEAAAHAIGKQIYILKASTDHEIDPAFATFVEQRVGALLVASDPFFASRRDQLVALAARHAIPSIYQWREFAEAGGLMSYGTGLAEVYHLVGVYTGKILNGGKPSNLPVQQAVKVELVINLKTAKTLGLTFPLSLLGRADEVIE